jgi:hypothetical protein
MTGPFRNRFSPYLAASLLVFVGVPPAVAEGPEVRVWRDSTGLFSVPAKLIGLDAGKVVLEKADGKSITLLKVQLSQGDLAFLAALAQPAGAKTSISAPEAANRYADALAILISKNETEDTELFQSAPTLANDFSKAIHELNSMSVTPNALADLILVREPFWLRKERLLPLIDSLALAEFRVGLARKHLDIARRRESTLAKVVKEQSVAQAHREANERYYSALRAQQYFMREAWAYASGNKAKIVHRTSAYIVISVPTKAAAEEAIALNLQKARSIADKLPELKVVPDYALNPNKAKQAPWKKHEELLLAIVKTQKDTKDFHAQLQGEL